MKKLVILLALIFAAGFYVYIFVPAPKKSSPTNRIPRYSVKSV